MTALAHPRPPLGRLAPHRSRTALLGVGRMVAPLALALIVGLVVLGCVALAIASIDTGGRLPHPRPLPAPSAPYFNGG